MPIQAYICARCRARFDSQPRLSDHIHTQHDTEDWTTLVEVIESKNEGDSCVYTCEFCSFGTTAGFEHLRSHWRSEHNHNERTCTCVVCTVRREALQAAMNNHAFSSGRSNSSRVENAPGRTVVRLLHNCPVNNRRALRHFVLPPMSLQGHEQLMSRSVFTCGVCRETSTFDGYYRGSYCDDSDNMNINIPAGWEYEWVSFTNAARTRPDNQAVSRNANEDQTTFVTRSSHRNSTLNSCPFCGRILEEVQRHICAIHMEEFRRSDVHYCTVCGQPCLSFTILERHNIENHDSENRCSKCNRHFINLATLNQHFLSCREGKGF